MNRKPLVIYSNTHTHTHKLRCFSLVFLDMEKSQISSSGETKESEDGNSTGTV